MFCERIPTPLDIASSTFMILDKGGIPRAELSPNDQLTFLSTIPDLSKTDNLSQIIISGLFEAIELAIRENLGGCNYLTIPAGTRMLLLYPIEVNIEPKHVEPFIIFVDSPAYLVNPVSSLFERRRIEATVNRFKIQYTQGFYSVQKDASYQKCLFSLIKRESLTFIIDKFQKGVIPYIDTVMMRKKIDLGVFLIFDSANYYYGGCLLKDKNIISTEPRIRKLIKFALEQLAHTGSEIAITKDQFGFMAMKIHGFKDRSKIIYSKIVDMIEDVYYNTENMSYYYPTVKDQNTVLAELPKMDSKLSLVVGLSTPETIAVQDLKDFLDILTKRFQSLNLTVVDDMPLTPGTHSYEKFNTLFNAIITNRDE